MPVTRVPEGTGLRHGLLLAPLVWLWLTAPVDAQLSPGELSRPHAQLEGAAHCLECHETRKGVDPEKCLSCHELLAARVRAGAGLHAREDYVDCKSCHIDHHGLEFELIWWGEQGMEGFDHRLTGFDLVAAHTALECRGCHRATLVLDQAGIAASGKSADRTFLGLGRDCLDCHPDEHRGQFVERTCVDCHAQESWTPASGFDHQQSRYALSGLHRNVTCEECHVLEPATDSEGQVFRRFVDVDFSSCANCHDDPHLGRFGAACVECHVTTGWLAIDERRFDHDLSRYPLTGRHREVACEACHPAGEPRGGVEFALCTDCHADSHLGQLSGRSDRGACESCHVVEGFSPTLFPVAEHQATWALEGAHMAVACDACHRSVEAAELIRTGVARAATESDERTVQLRFATSECIDCHPDPHLGSEEDGAADSECLACHVVASWRDVTFDHAATDFTLLGRHADLACGECHAGSEGDTRGPVFSTSKPVCASCHADPHRGQFVDSSTAVGCERCHGQSDWQPATGFDHDRDARFHLEGGHRDVACARCHLHESADGISFVRYRPLDPACSACHADQEVD